MSVHRFVDMKANILNDLLFINDYWNLKNKVKNVLNDERRTLDLMIKLGE